MHEEGKWIGEGKRKGGGGERKGIRGGEGKGEMEGNERGGERVDTARPDL